MKTIDPKKNTRSSLKKFQPATLPQPHLSQIKGGDGDTGDDNGAIGVEDIVIL